MREPWWLVGIKPPLLTAIICFVYLKIDPSATPESVGVLAALVLALSAVAVFSYDAGGATQEDGDTDA